MMETTLRPAWRNYWLEFLAVFTLLAMAVFSAIGALHLGVLNEEPPADLSVNPESVLYLLGAAIAVIYAVVRRFLWRFKVDGNRVTRQYGIVFRNEQTVRIKDVRSIELDQSLIQRIFGVGDLAFYSSGSSRAEVRFVGIRQPSQWRDKIEAAIDQSG